VLVVDNSPGDKDTENVAREYSVRYVVEPRQGLSRARNRGLAESSSDIIAYVDDDAAPEPDWLGIILSPFEDEKVAVSTGRVITPESHSDKSDHENVRILSSKDPKWFEIATFGGLGLGGNMALRKTACSGLHVFDERLGRGAPLHIGEETYAYARLLSRGYSAVYVPSAVVFHPSLRRDSLEVEARNSIAYWLLLFSEFPDRRADLLRFVFRRLRRQRLSWPRQNQEPGEIITSSWRLKLKAGISGTLLFLQTRKPKRA
jgi:glycosyltransferase involved in cell wall biosynthesis